MKSARASGRWTTSRTLRRTPPHGGRMPRQCEVGDLRELVAIEPQDVDVAVDEVADVKVAPVWAERHALGEATHVDLSHLAYCLSIDLQERDIRVFMPVEGGLGGGTGSVEKDRRGITSGRAHRESFRTIADNHLIDDTGWVCLEIDDADGVDLAILTATVVFAIARLPSGVTW